MDDPTCVCRRREMPHKAPQDITPPDCSVSHTDKQAPDDVPVTFTLRTDQVPGGGVVQGSWLWWVEAAQEGLSSCLLQHATLIRHSLVLALVVLYCVYLGFVFTRSSGWGTLIAVTVIVLVLFVYEQFSVRYGRRVRTLVTPLCRTVGKVWNVGKWVLLPCGLAALGVYLSTAVIKAPTQGLALVGYCVFTCLTLLTSTHVTQIGWRPVVVGLGLQVSLAVLLLRVGAAYRAAHWVGEQVGALLRHSLRGGSTAFGNPTAFLHPLLMVVCPVIIYVGATMAFLSHTGLTPYLTSKLSWLAKVTFNISHIEAKVMAEGLFSGMMEYVMSCSGYVRHLTPSELLLTLVMAHSNLQGFMYSLFSVFWVVPDTLVVGALLAAPAGLALSKLSAPEVHVSHLQASTGTEWGTEDKEYRNIAERTALGAWQAGKVVLSIVVQVIAFLSMYELFDVILTWIGNLANIELNFKVAFSYLFLPLAYLLGVPGEEVNTCSYILGLSLTQNEILAYLELGSLRMAGTLTRRTEAITTAAICGFSSFASMTLVVGGWYSASPTTYRRAIRSLWRVYFITKMASLTTACLFGVLYDEALVQSFESGLDLSTGWLDLGRLLSIIPSYKQLLPWLGIKL